MSKPDIAMLQRRSDPPTTPQPTDSWLRSSAGTQRVASVAESYYELWKATMPTWSRGGGSAQRPLRSPRRLPHPFFACVPKCAR
eukprot:5127881-Pleurochrysis_carterae.AAC.1